VRQFFGARGNRGRDTRGMGVAEALDQMPRSDASAVEGFREALAMFEEGVALQHLNFRRRHPKLSELELDKTL
jgi:Rv0078B-related antitoxin